MYHLREQLASDFSRAVIFVPKKCSHLTHRREVWELLLGKSYHKKEDDAMKIEKRGPDSYRVRKMYKGQMYTVAFDHKPTQKEAMQTIDRKSVV